MSSMIISHQYRYVFVQVMKTASTAIAVELCLHYGGSPILEKHSTIGEFRAWAKTDWHDYFTFAGIRNPLDVSVSRYQLRKAGLGNQLAANLEQHEFIKQNRADFSTYFVEFVSHRHQQGYDIGMVPMDWDRPDFQSIDYIYRYENIQQEFRHILFLLGLTPVRDLPLTNKTASKNRDFIKYYNNEAKEVAMWLFGEYLTKWSYPLQTE